MDKLLFEKALEENRIVRYKNDFKAVVKSYLRLQKESDAFVKMCCCGKEEPLTNNTCKNCGNECW